MTGRALLVVAALVAAWLPVTDTTAQADDDSDLLELSLVALLEIDVTGASKKAERAFEAPVSISVVTRREIKASGVASVPEALRLIPGLLIREMSNGNFDVQIRGGQNRARGALASTVNSHTLVMIDGRIVYNYRNGSVLWPAIGISIEDVERIEAIRGPASALYGPNAAAGVINIITRRGEAPGWSSQVHAEGGIAKPYSYRLADEKLDHVPLSGRASGRTTHTTDTTTTTLSVFAERRDRSQEPFFSFPDDRYVEDVRTVPDALHQLITSQRVLPENAQEAFPNLNRSLERWGAGVSGRLAPHQELEVTYAAGIQNTTWMDTSFSPQVSTMMQTQNVDSGYANLGISAHGFHGRASFQNLTVDAPGFQVEPFDPDRMRTFEADAEYRTDFHGLEIRPGLSFKQVMVASGLLEGGRAGIRDRLYAASLRMEYTVAKRLRLVGAVRGDLYEVNASSVYPAWNLDATYEPHENHLLRVGWGRGYRYNFILDRYTDRDFGTVNVRGNRKVDPFKITSLEGGYRASIAGRLSLDVEGFLNFMGDYAFPNFDDYDTFDQTYQNMPTEIRHYGGSLSLSFVQSSDFEARVHATVQHSDIRYQVTENLPGADPVVTDDWAEDKTSPSWYGGLSVTYRPIDPLSLHAHAYLAGPATVEHTNYNMTDDLETLGILNLKVSYELAAGFEVFGNIRNINLTGSPRQAPWSDDIGELYLIGLNYDR